MRLNPHESFPGGISFLLSKPRSLLIMRAPLSVKIPKPDVRHLGQKSHDQESNSRRVAKEQYPRLAQKRYGRAGNLPDSMRPGLVLQNGGRCDPGKKYGRIRQGGGPRALAAFPDTVVVFRFAAPLLRLDDTLYPLARIRRDFHTPAPELAPGSRDRTRGRSGALTIYSITVLTGLVGVRAYPRKRGAKTQTALQGILQQDVLARGIGALLTSYERGDGGGFGPEV